MMRSDGKQPIDAVAGWQIQRARAGAKRAAKLAEKRGVAMPSDRWNVR
jgi:hypothetical protein